MRGIRRLSECFPQHFPQRYASARLTVERFGARSRVAFGCARARVAEEVAVWMTTCRCATGRKAHENGACHHAYIDGRREFRGRECLSIGETRCDARASLR